MESILTSIKKLLGLEEDYTHFDMDITIYINSAFSTLTQLGVGPVAGFSIQDKSSTWDEFIGDRIDAEFIKPYVYLKTRLLFDPPQSGFLIDNMNKQLSEIEWRLNIQAEGGIT